MDTSSLNVFEIYVTMKFVLGPYSYVKALHPKISESGFQLEDLFWDETQKNIRARETKVLRSFRLVIARNIPLPAEGWL